jgi:NTP pyrophosphatase (non-canonical NTP hydrolase)
MDNNTTLSELKDYVRVFCEDRDWDQYHGAKDLSIGIITESSELLELFRFKDKEEVEKLFKTPSKKEIAEEISDILFFIFRFAQKYDIDISEAFGEKMQKNNEKYPIHKSKGSNKKYTEL